MGHERFKQLGEESFFGRMVYERVIPRDHFLMRLNETVPWHRFSYKLVKYYRGGAKQGRPPYDPAMLLKMLLVAFLYNLSERQVEEVANFNLPVKCFLGLAADELAPDHSTLTAFKSRIVENGRLEAFEKLLAEIVGIAREKGIAFGTIQVMDSVHTIADVNVEKDKQRRDKGGQGPRDPNARWGVKGSHRRQDETGQVVKQKEYFFGYKAHVSLNAENGLITSMVHTPGNAYDGHELPALVQKDLAQGLPVSIVTADRGYDDSDNHELLFSQGIHSAIRLQRYRTKKKDPHKDVWLRLKQSPQYQEGLAERYKIERKFGEAKQQHGLRRCRYVGIVRYAIQGFMTALALNLKRMVLLLTGAPFKGRARALA
jgi:IS5 family transposase